MKVSVVIPTHNHAHLISYAIDSILQQTFSKFEIIVVDDGSTDGTAEVLHSRYNGKIIYISQARQGPAIARNTGMQVARGEYIAFLDSDDLYYPYKLEIQKCLLDDYPDIGMIYTEFSAIDDDGIFEEFHLKQYHKSAYINGGLNYTALFQNSYQLPAYRIVPKKYRNQFFYTGHIYDSYMLNTVVFTNSMMFRRNILSKIGLQLPRFKFFEEMEFALRLCKYYKVGFLDIPTYKLRYHPGQISSTCAPEGKLTAIRKQQNLLRVLKLHIQSDADYYHKYKDRIDKQLARLYRAVAILMLAYDGPAKHARHYYPRRARAYFEKCKTYGRPEHVLQSLTYLPFLLRRVAFKLNTATLQFLKLITKYNVENKS